MKAERKERKMPLSGWVIVGLLDTLAGVIAGAAVKLGALTQADCDRIVNVLTALGFDLTPPVEVKRLLKEVGKDKKNEDGMLRIVLPVGIGDCEVRPMTMDAFAALF